MRLWSRVLLTAGLACLSTAVLAGGALAHGGGHGSKFNKGSHRGHADLAVAVRGTITGLQEATGTTPGFVTVSASDVTPAPAGLEWKCVIPAGSQSTGLKVTDPVKLRCRDIDGVLTAVKLRLKNHGHHDHSLMDHGNGGRGKVEVDARGKVVKIDTMTSNMMAITVDPGTETDQLAPFSCNIGPRTRILGTPEVNDIVKISCRSKDGALVARKIKEKGQIHPGEIQVKIEALIATIVPGSPGSPGAITFLGGASCLVTDATLVAGLMPKEVVEAKCTGNPLTLTKIHPEDHDNH